MQAKLKAIIAFFCCVTSVTCDSGMEASSKINNSIKQNPSPTPTPYQAPTSGQESQDLCNEQIQRIQQARILSLKAEALEEAISKYKELIEQGCDTSNSRFNLGLALGAAKRWDEAVEQYHIILKREPQNWAAHWVLAQTLILELRQYEEGLKEVQTARRLDNGADVGYNYEYFIGKAFDGMGNYNEALKHYEIYVKAQSKVWDKEPKLLEAKERILAIKAKNRFALNSRT